MVLNVDMGKTASEISDSIFIQLDEYYGDDVDDKRWDQQEGALEETLEECEDIGELYYENGWGSLSDILDCDDISEERKKEAFSIFKEKLEKRAE